VIEAPRSSEIDVQDDAVCPAPVIDQVEMIRLDARIDDRDGDTRAVVPRARKVRRKNETGPGRGVEMADEACDLAVRDDILDSFGLGEGLDRLEGQLQGNNADVLEVTANFPAQLGDTIRYMRAILAIQSHHDPDRPGRRALARFVLEVRGHVVLRIR